MSKYEVTFYSTYSYSTIVEAECEDDAYVEAEARFMDADLSDYSYDDGGIDSNIYKME